MEPPTRFDQPESPSNVGRRPSKSEMLDVVFVVEKAEVTFPVPDGVADLGRPLTLGVTNESWRSSRPFFGGGGMCLDCPIGEGSRVGIPEASALETPPRE